MTVTGELSTDGLRAMQKEMVKHAHAFGLDFPEVIFEVVDSLTISQLAALGGFPVRYPHWSFGMEYLRLTRSYGYGLHRIYEMVINTDPCYAYLLASNQPVDQKLVMIHVYGHAHFFKNNMWFAHTNRDMLDKMADHAARISRYIDRHGFDEVEKFIDWCLSIERLIDMHAVGIQRKAEEEPKEEPERLARLPAKDYMDRFINPPAVLEKQWKDKEIEKELAKKRFPKEPERDVLYFLMHHAQLEDWQRDILGIIRDESYYFTPQGQTKIINEGFATFCHSRVMTTKACTAEEIIDYAEHYTNGIAVHHGSLNPYRLGLKLLLDIEERWDKGQFGSEWDECVDVRERENWDLKLGLGKEKVFQVAKIYNDIGLIDEFLTYDFALKERLFTYDYNERQNVYYISGRDFEEIKKRILFSLTNYGRPIIEVVDGNYGNKGELYLLHEYEDVSLDIPYAERTLLALYHIWGRPVHLETVDREVKTGGLVSETRRLYSRYSESSTGVITIGDVTDEKKAKRDYGGVRG